MTLRDTNAQQDAGMDRRRLLKTAGLGAASAVAIGATAGAGLVASTVPARAATYTDADILNFALNLEYLEAEFYLRATTGQGLAAADTTGVGTQGTVSGPVGTPVPFRTQYIAQLADDIAADEQAHVRLLRAALGSAAVAEPQIDVMGAFTTLALAAGIIAPGTTFNPYQDEIAFLVGAYIFEDVGVTAYGGAAGLITSKAYLSAAASILAVEAYHAATVRTLLTTLGEDGTVTGKISALRATLSQSAAASPTPGAVDDFGGRQSTGQPNVGPFDANALTFQRTPAQVLSIVYGTPNGAGKGGLFFPNKVNGLFA